MTLSRCISALLVAVGLVAGTACHDLDPDMSPEELPTCTTSTDCGGAGAPPWCTEAYDVHLDGLYYDRCFTASMIVSTWTCPTSKLNAVRDGWPYSGKIVYYDAVTNKPVGMVMVNGNNKKTACHAIAPGFVAPADCVAVVADVCNNGLPDGG